MENNKQVKTRMLTAGNYFELDGEVALVTGASSGLGRHFAQVLAAAGVIVGVAARRASKIESLVLEIEAAGGRAVPLTMDVTDQQQVKNGLKSLVEQVGPVSILINNAGKAVPQKFLDAQPGDTEEVFALNQMAVWQVGQQLATHMKTNKLQGRIINIASIGGLRPMGGAASYAVSKAAVVQLTKVMAMELARYGIRANALAPGYIQTELNHEFLQGEQGQKLLNRSPMRRSGELAELDAALLMLASPVNSFMTGSIIPVDGGHLVSSL